MVRSDPKQKKLAFDRSKSAERPKASTNMAESAVDTGGTSTQVGLDTIMAELKTGFRAIDARFDTITTRLDRMGERLDKQDARILNAEGRVSTLEDTSTTVVRRLERLETRLKTMAIKNEDLEARGRRNSIRIVGIAESTSTGRIDLFVEHLLTELFDRKSFTSNFVVERAHRSLGPRPVPGAPARPIIARLLNFRDRDTVLRLARESGGLRYHNSAISIYPDFTMAVQDARRKYTDARVALRKLGIRYGMLYPAKLLIDVDGKAKFFETPAEVMSFCKNYTPRRSTPDRGGAGGTPTRSQGAMSVDLFTSEQPQT